MRALENRNWYGLLSVYLSALIVLSLWHLAELRIRLSVISIFLFATGGVWMGLHRLLALVLIRVKPSLGALK